MPVEIRVPALGESVVEATIAQWLKSPGDTVEAGEPIVELETDKVNVEVPAEVAGVLGAVAKQVGETVGVGEVLGTVSENGAAAAPSPVAAAPAAPEPSAPPIAATSSPSAPANGSAAHTTPTAAAMAAANNIDLAGVTGTLAGGRIGKDDVARAAQAPATAQQKMEERSAPPAATSAARPAATSVATTAPATVSASGRPEERIKMSKRRQTIARNLVQAQQTAAMLTTFNEIDMSAVMEVRSRRKDKFKEKFGVGLGFMSFFTKACVGALKQFPYVNAEIQGDEVVLKKYYDIGIAVGLEEGLVVPVVRDADRLTFAGIEKEIATLASKARENKLSLAELTGGTFTITNGGTFGSLMSTPILNAPQVGILGMHNIVQRPVVVNGEIAIRPMMYVALSYDHRIIDGSTAVRFLVKLKELIEDPESLLLEG